MTHTHKGGQRHDHGIHIGNRIGGGYPSEVELVIHCRHEEVGCGDQCLFIIELVNGGGVRGLDADHQFFEDGKSGRILQDFRQYARRNFAAATAAVIKLSRFYVIVVGQVHDRYGMGHLGECNYSELCIRGKHRCRSATCCAMSR